MKPIRAFEIKANAALPIQVTELPDRGFGRGLHLYRTNLTGLGVDVTLGHEEIEQLRAVLIEIE